MKREIICGIYIIISPSDKAYIGKASDIFKRWGTYKRLNCKQQRVLHRSFVKYGVDTHKFEILEECTLGELNEREIYYIKLYKTYIGETGLNLTYGGEGSIGYKHTEEAKKKASELAKGRIMPEGIRKRISQVLIDKYKTEDHHSKGKPQSESLISKRVAKTTGKKRTEETKKIMSEKAKGNQVWLGRKHKPETIEKIRMANIGKKCSLETIEKNRLARIGYKPSRQSIEKRIEKVSKIILNTQTGIFYIGVKEAADSIGSLRGTLSPKLTGHKRNNTSFIYV